MQQALSQRGRLLRLTNQPGGDMLSGAMMHAMGDCTPELSCGCLQPRTDHRAKAEAILEEHGSPNDPHGRAIAHALIAIHDLLAQRLPTARPSRRRRRGLGL